MPVENYLLKLKFGSAIVRCGACFYPFRLHLDHLVVCGDGRVRAVCIRCRKPGILSSFAVHDEKSTSANGLPNKPKREVDPEVTLAKAEAFALQGNYTAALLLLCPLLGYPTPESRAEFIRKVGIRTSDLVYVVRASLHDNDQGVTVTSELSPKTASKKALAALWECHYKQFKK